MKVLQQFCLIILTVASAKKFQRCEFARLAKENGLSEVGVWTCVAFQESGLISDTKNGNYYGIFQISGGDWCGDTDKKCQMSCDKLLDSDLSDDFSCMKLIHNWAVRLPDKDGFRPWSSAPYCKKYQDRWVKGCDI